MNKYMMKIVDLSNDVCSCHKRNYYFVMNKINEQNCDILKHPHLSKVAYKSCLQTPTL